MFLIVQKYAYFRKQKIFTLIKADPNHLIKVVELKTWKVNTDIAA